MEEPALPQNASSTSSAPQAQAGVSAAAQAPPPFQSVNGGHGDNIPLPAQAAARLVRYPAQPARQQPAKPVKKYQAYQEQNMQPIQPVYHKHQDAGDNEIHVLQAPQVKQVHYPGQGQNTETSSALFSLE